MDLNPYCSNCRSINIYTCFAPCNHNYCISCLLFCGIKNISFFLNDPIYAKKKFQHSCCVPYCNGTLRIPTSLIYERLNDIKERKILDYNKQLLDSLEGWPDYIYQNYQAWIPVLDGLVPRPY